MRLDTVPSIAEFKNRPLFNKQLFYMGLEFSLVGLREKKQSNP